MVAVVPEARNGKAPRGLVGGAGYIPRFRNLKGGAKARNFIRGYAFDFNTGGTPDVRYFPSWGEELEKDLDSCRGAGFSATAMGEVLPRFENHVRIDPAKVDAWGIPVLNFQCRYTETSSTWRRMPSKHLARCAGQAKFEVLHRNDKMFPPGHSIHELGTCRMGENPKTQRLEQVEPEPRYQKSVRRRWKQLS